MPYLFTTLNDLPHELGMMGKNIHVILLFFLKLNCNTRENSNFIRNGKTVILVEDPEFF